MSIPNRQYSVYIVTNVNNKILYTGVTSNLEHRSYEHKNKLLKGFTAKYNLNKYEYRIQRFVTRLEIKNIYCLPRLLRRLSLASSR